MFPNISLFSCWVWWYHDNHDSEAWSDSGKHGVITCLHHLAGPSRRAATGSQFSLGAAWVGALFGIIAWRNPAPPQLQTIHQSVKKLQDVSFCRMLLNNLATETPTPNPPVNLWSPTSLSKYISNLTSKGFQCITQSNYSFPGTGQQMPVGRLCTGWHTHQESNRSLQHFPKMDERTFSYYTPGTAGAMQVWGKGCTSYRDLKTVANGRNNKTLECM